MSRFASKLLAVWISLILWHPAVAQPEKLPNLEETWSSVKGTQIQITPGVNGLLLAFVSEHCPIDLNWRNRLHTVTQKALENKMNVFVINSHSAAHFKENNLTGMKSAAAQFPSGVEYIADSSQAVARNFKIQRTPQVLIYGSDRRLLYSGPIDDDPDLRNSERKNFAVQIINEIASSTANKTSSKQSVLGCALKGVKP